MILTKKIKKMKNEQMMSTSVKISKVHIIKMITEDFQAALNKLI